MTRSPSISMTIMEVSIHQKSSKGFAMTKAALDTFPCDTHRNRVMFLKVHFTPYLSEHIVCVQMVDITCECDIFLMTPKVIR